LVDQLLGLILKGGKVTHPSGEHDDFATAACGALLKAGVRQQVPFHSERLAARRVAAGSRIVVVLGIVKRPDRQINYGTGDDVSEESIEDARIPMKIRWYGGSYVDLPVRR